MLELVKYIVNQFAEKKEDIEFTESERDGAAVITVTLDPSDMGKVIGKQGKIAKSLRTLVRAATPAGGKKYIVEIRERGGDKVDTDPGDEAEEEASAE